MHVRDMLVRFRRVALAIASAVLTIGMVAVAPLDAIGSPTRPAVQHSKAFVMPSRNIACLYDSGKIRCDIFSGLKPEPTKPCKYYWKGVLLPGAGQPTFLCIIDTIYDPSAPVLQFGSRWSRGSIACTSRTRGLRCYNDVGHGFFLSRGLSRKW